MLAYMWILFNSSCWIISCSLRNISNSFTSKPVVISHLDISCKIYKALMLYPRKKKRWRQINKVRSVWMCIVRVWERPKGKKKKREPLCVLREGGRGCNKCKKISGEEQRILNVDYSYPGVPSDSNFTEDVIFIIWTVTISCKENVGQETGLVAGWNAAELRLCHCRLHKVGPHIHGLCRKSSTYWYMQEKCLSGTCISF